MAGSARLVGAIGLLLVLAGASVALATWHRGESAAATRGTNEVIILGPEGPLFSGQVDVEAATALSVLEAAAAAADLALVIERYPGMGAYVRAIGPYAASGASGWVYEVGAEGAWTLGDRSAALRPLADGEAVRWRWTNDGT